jgi:hypothetical protein
MQVADQVGVS